MDLEFVLGLLAVLAGLAGLVFVAVYHEQQQGRKVKAIEDRMRRLTDFDPSDVLVSKENLTGVAIDLDRRKLLLADEMCLRQFRASQIISCEILEDEVQLAFVNRGSQLIRGAIGGVAFGGIGAAVGALSASRRSVDNVKKVVLRFVTDDFDRPTHDVVLLDWSFRKKGLKREGLIYRQALGEAELWHGRVKALLKREAAEEAGH